MKIYIDLVIEKTQ